MPKSSWQAQNGLLVFCEGAIFGFVLIFFLFAFYLFCFCYFLEKENMKLGGWVGRRRRGSEWRWGKKTMRKD